jgi:DNA-binding Lrp family transcriptional regulator
MKNQTLKLLRALLQNSKRSDRELAKVIGVSQPTVTRNRKLLAEYIRSYTIVPEFSKIGYEILALTFAKARTYDRKTVDVEIPMMKEWFMKRGNVIFVSDGEGLGKDLVIVSVHKNYSGYATFMRDSAMNFADIASDFQSFVVSLKTGMITKPFDLTYLADDIEEPAKQP